jgi:hypothetical protein
VEGSLLASCGATAGRCERVNQANDGALIAFR